ncbi:MAG TPA: hypothetical protein VM662_14930, partial [Sphingomonas sp.]|nr:hypothetical protein [Sphingomonas sp.]
GNAVAITACLLVMWSFGTGAFGEVGASGTAALAVGVLFLVIGVFIAAGLADPRVGARYLNVEDADDLREQRPLLWRSAGGMVAWGLALVLLAAAGPSGSIPPTAALAGAGTLLVAGLAFTIAAWQMMDELMRRLATEAGNISYYLIALAGGGWATLAHLGFVTAPAPLDWLTMLTGLVLAASFIVAARRGLMAQRQDLTAWGTEGAGSPETGSWRTEQWPVASDEPCSRR